ncbi:MAG: 3-oxoacyl-ACP reductase FabG [Candidatus Aminicenantes bacterium]|nr:3-oxoacyl-ACP reductase FabG [Candidatus Aminicenantes bacterium]MBL7082766.1 3-oxoacyl-ACP reductase FabG [Candidatus Aminicenantes bacterium]
MDLDGKVALVTGGSLGIGTEISLDLARNGADVALTFRRHEKEAKAVVEQIKAMGRKTQEYKVDVSDFGAVQKLVKQVIDEFGHMDILISNAGMNWDGVIWKMTEEQWDAVINVDLKGTFNFIRAVAPTFREQKSGKIVNITSINGLRGKFGQTNYSAAKAGAIGLTKTVAKELGKYSVNVNAVAPGMILTDMFKELSEEFKQKAAEETVFNRLGQPEDIAHLVSFLCSEKAKHITGEVIKVDGGQYI